MSLELLKSYCNKLNTSPVNELGGMYLSFFEEFEKYEQGVVHSILYEVEDEEQVKSVSFELGLHPNEELRFLLEEAGVNEVGVVYLAGFFEKNSCNVKINSSINSVDYSNELENIIYYDNIVKNDLVFLKIINAYLKTLLEIYS